MERETTSKTLILGLGNLLLGDEGVGVHAARALIKEGCPDGTTVLDIGTAVLDALPALEWVDRLIAVDAVKAGRRPGTIYRMALEGFGSPQCIASMHGLGLTRVLALAGRSELPEVLVFGVEPAHMDWSLELSPPVAEAMPCLLEAIRREVELQDPPSRSGSAPNRPPSKAG